MCIFLALDAVNASQTVSRLSEWTAAVKQWLTCNDLQLNRASPRWWY